MDARLAAPENYIISWLRAQGGGVSAPLGEIVCLGTRPGKARTANQDRVLFASFGDERGETVNVCVLCDGMGGMASGDRCAEVGISSFLLALVGEIGSGRNAQSALGDAANYANRRLYEEFGGRGGTTLAAILIHRGSALACSVGDSRILGVRSDGLRQLSRDDTIRGALDAVGRKSPNGADRVEEHERLVQFIGMGGDLEPHVFVVEDHKDYRFLLACSDGAYRPPRDQLPALSGNAMTPKQLVQRLLALTDWLGGNDDASIVVVDARIVAHPAAHAAPQRGTIDLWGPVRAGALMNVRSDVSKMELFPRPSARPAHPPSLSSSPEAIGGEIKGDHTRYPRKKKQRRDRSLPLKSSAGEVVIEVGPGEQKRDDINQKTDATTEEPRTHVQPRDDEGDSRRGR